MNVKYLILGSALFIFGSVLAWYASNLQFVSPWWKDRPFLSILIFSMPTATVYYFGTRYAYEGFGDTLWGVRFLSYSLSYLVFPFMTFYYLGEPVFTPKTLTCILLSVLILYVQVKM